MSLDQVKSSYQTPSLHSSSSGAFGSGLAILSRQPIVATQTHPYSLNGHPIFVHHGDWIAAKAAGCVTLSVEGLGLVDVWNTHTVAAGGEDGPESRRAHRVSQAYELASFAKLSAERGHHVICVSIGRSSFVRGIQGRYSEDEFILSAATSTALHRRSPLPYSRTSLALLMPTAPPIRSVQLMRRRFPTSAA